MYLLQALLFYIRKEQMRFHKVVRQKATRFSLGQDQAFVCLQDTCLMDKQTAMSKLRDRVASAIGKLHLKVFQDLKQKCRCCILWIGIAFLFFFSWSYFHSFSLLLALLWCSYWGTVFLVKITLAVLCSSVFVLSEPCLDHEYSSFSSRQCLLIM